MKNILLFLLLATTLAVGQTPTDIDHIFVSADGSDSHHPNKAVMEAENKLHSMCQPFEGPKQVNTITTQALKNEKVVSVGYAEGHFFAVVTGDCVVFATAK